VATRGILAPTSWAPYGEQNGNDASKPHQNDVSLNTANQSMRERFGVPMSGVPRYLRLPRTFVWTVESTQSCRWWSLPWFLAWCRAKISRKTPIRGASLGSPIRSPRV